MKIQMLVMILLIIAILPSIARAGMDFTWGANDRAMNAKYQVPFFKEKIDAINYAHRIKWNEEVLKAFYQAEYEAYYEKYDRHNGWKADWFGEESNMYQKYWQCLQLAIHIMEDYKKKGEHGEDPAQVGSSIVASSIPLIKGQQ